MTVLHISLPEGFMAPNEVIFPGRVVGEGADYYLAKYMYEKNDFRRRVPGILSG